MEHLVLSVLVSSFLLFLTVRTTGQTEPLISVDNLATFNASGHGVDEPQPSTFADLTDDLRSWQAPDFIKKNFPYYMSGLDYEGHPVWIAEMGKYNLRALIQRGPEAEEALSKAIAQAARFIVDSFQLKYADNTEGAYIVDLDGLRYEQFADIPSIAFLFREGRRYRKLLQEGASYVAIINANYVAQTVIAMLRPVLGQLWEVVEIFGSDKSKWLPRLLRKFPPESLPEWYGGYKNFTPIKVLP